MEPDNSELLQALPQDWERALAVVAHPDDLEYGMASAVARWTSEGKSVSYVLLTSGEAGIDSMSPEEAGPLRAQEERSSAAIVGVEEVEFLGHRDGMIEYGLSLRRDIAAAIRRYRPEIMLTINHHPTWGGRSFNMSDHRAVGLAVIDAARDAGNRWVFRELIDQGLEPWNGVRMVCVNGSPHPTHAVDVRGFLDRGVDSLLAHHAYLDNLGEGFDARSFLESGASHAGRQAGVKHAVGFEVIDV